MRKVIPIIVILLDIALICFSAAILSVVVAMSVMIFDAGESAGAWGMFATIATICILLLVSAMYYAVRYFKKKRYVVSVLSSAIPLIAFLLMQLLVNAV
ncbi:MAG: hypothetical protein HOG89_00750 [Candidatus Peribacter sp.]|jgi:hypothetical protein|nr:hypothetical protein [Candidatus Peribacter sp.]MBT4392948.1 hypothetical protein [Candidatus Peribacter sp.]MBT4601008.1 hypothetical protein [Candidatus Peribacter sp.]MBT5149050.1 hypothetical protein [Candidatus Peribacter sp.]MBT5637374.1 hypothetical protein [Candidatus Peribacter sp.]